MNRSLPQGDGRRSPDACRPSGSGRAVSRAVGLVGGTAADQRSAATARVFIVSKHGGFERRLLETLCALGG